MVGCRFLKMSTLSDVFITKQDKYYRPKNIPLLRFNTHVTRSCASAYRTDSTKGNIALVGRLIIFLKRVVNINCISDACSEYGICRTPFGFYITLKVTVAVANPLLFKLSCSSKLFIMLKTSQFSIFVLYITIAFFTKVHEVEPTFVIQY
jgi:hypothetical protein